MIVCKECGHQNEDDDLFCGNCPAFLEYSGERIGGPEPVLERGRPGIATGVGDEDPARDQRQRSPAADGRRLRRPARRCSPPGSDAPSMRARRPVRRPERRRRRREPATSGRRRWWPSPTHSSHPTRGRQSRREHRRRSVRRRRCRDRRSPSRPRAARSTPATSSAACAAKATIPSATTAGDVASTLAEATVARTRWFRRRPKRSKKVVAAGDRPGRRDAARRRRRGRARRRTRQVPRAALRLQADPGPPGDRRDRGRVRRAEPSQLADRQRVGRLQQGQAHREPRVHEHPRRPGADHVVGRGTRAARRPTSPTATRSRSGWPDAAPASVSVGFVEPTDVEHVLVHPGQQEDGGKVVRPDPRPRALLFRLTSVRWHDHRGRRATLEDKDGFQKVDPRDRRRDERRDRRRRLLPRSGGDGVPDHRAGVPDGEVTSPNSSSTPS